MTIQSWFFQMESYFRTYRLPSDRCVDCCVSMFYGTNFDEVEPHKTLAYDAFKPVILELFRRPVLTQFKMQQLIELRQADKETPEEFMVRVCNLTQQA